jgi:EpsD family peptidyl-prolyl cis-trans isomerase
MKSKALLIAMCLATGITMSGCDRVKGMIGGKPKGQVVATVNGEEITALELRSELGGFGSRDPAVMKAAQQQALERIILRRILAQEAKKQKLDKTPEFTTQLHRGEETLLAQLYQRKLAQTVGQASKQDAQAYVAAHPDQFANRRVLFVDQVIAAPNKIPVERYKPLKSLTEVKALLDSEGVVYQQNAVVLDTLSADPRIVAQLATLPPGEVFLIPQQGALLFNQINDQRSTPFTGDMAVNYAMNVIRGQKAQETVGKRIEAMRKAAEKEVVYNAAYNPKAPPAKAGAAAPAKK